MGVSPDFGADFKYQKKQHSHVGDNCNLLELLKQINAVNIRATIKQYLKCPGDVDCGGQPPVSALFCMGMGLSLWRAAMLF